MSVLGVKDVAEWLGVEVAQINATQCQIAIDGVEAHAAKITDVPDLENVGDPPRPMWVDLDYKLGILMLIARLRKRPESPQGTIGFDGVSIAGFDSDISRMLAAYEKTGVGRFG